MRSRCFDMACSFSGTVCDSPSFSNFFKFLSAFFLILAISLADWQSSMASAKKSGHFFTNNVDAPDLVLVRVCQFVCV